jgi:hypothetical protein
MGICDSCGALADAGHVRQRIERLELATRYRPVHIQTLIVGDAPPLRDEEYFYASAKEAEELQRNGMFLVYAVECPLAEGVDRAATVRAAATTFVKRVKLSYKPKSILLFSAGTAELIAGLREAGFGESLVLAEGKPFAELPDWGKRAI